MTWAKLMKGIYQDGGWFIINQKDVDVEGFGYQVDKDSLTWCVYGGGKQKSSHNTLWEAKTWAGFLSGW